MVQPAGALWRGVLHSRMTMMAMAMRIQYVMRRTAGSEPEFVDGGVMGAAGGTWEEGVGLAGRTGAALPVCCWGGGDGFTLAGGGEVSRDGSLWRGAAGGGGAMTGTAGGGGEGPWHAAARWAPPVRSPPQAV